MILENHCGVLNMYYFSISDKMDTKIHQKDTTVFYFSAMVLTCILVLICFFFMPPFRNEILFLIKLVDFVFSLDTDLERLWKVYLRLWLLTFGDYFWKNFKITCQNLDIKVIFLYVTYAFCRCNSM